MGLRIENIYKDDATFHIVYLQIVIFIVKILIKISNESAEIEFLKTYSRLLTIKREEY